MHKYRARHGVIESGYFNADRRVLSNKLQQFSPGKEAIGHTTYERHRPEQTLLYQLIDKHYPGFWQIKLLGPHKGSTQV